jgi:gliding motility-associated-like protein
MRPRPSIIQAFVFLLLLAATGSATAQRVFVNNPNGFYELTGGPGNCTYVPINNPCTALTTTGTYSMAVYKDTIYYLNGPYLYSFKIDVPGSCTFYRDLGGSFTSMTVDQNGILYFANSFLYRYNPYTNQLANLGNMPFSSAGDLIFFNGKLLMAGNPPGIYEINIANPAASTLYMGVNGLQLFGLVSYPVPCGNSRYFGLAPMGGLNNTMMYELDLVNKVVLGNNCNVMGISVYDAGSTTESGLNAGITVTSLQVTHPCPPSNIGSVNISAVADTFTVSYTLNNTVTNTTGLFPNLPVGQHTIRIQASGCTLDTVVQISAGLSPVVGIQAVQPNNCDGNNGSLTLSASSGHQPVTYTMLNNGQQNTTGSFSNLVPGTYQFRINDAQGCSRDTFALLVQQPPVLVQSINVVAARCGNNAGAIRLNIVGGDTTGVTSSLSGAAYLPRVSYTNLAPGVYNIRARKGTLCFFDTTVTILNINDPKPLLNVQVGDQSCYGNNGSITVAAAANGYTFEYRLNTGSYSNNGSFGSLAPGSYTLGIRNQFGCAWDTAITIRAYPKFPVSATVAATDPDCENPFDGSIRVTVNGVEGPYSLLLRGNTYANGNLITGLTEGNYNLVVVNKDGCAVDSVLQTLRIIFQPRCVTVFIPSAFTPNGDGRNDLFRPSQTFFTSNMRLQVFNRYGQTVYSGTGPNVQWDGSFKGKPQPAGAYVYWLTYTDFNGVDKKLKGSVLLVR